MQYRFILSSEVFQNAYTGINREHTITQPMKTALSFLLLWLSLSVSAQDTITSVITITTDSLTERQIRQMQRQHRRDSIRAHKKIWASVLGGPSYTPEASLGIGGALLATFRVNKYDTVSQRSFLPAGFNVSINGTFVAAGAGALFFNENRFRIYLQYGFRNEPTDFFGVGFAEIKENHKSDSTTGFKKNTLGFMPRFVWEIRKNIYAGGIFDINYNKVRDIGTVLKDNAYYRKYGKRFTNIGLGAVLQYDSRDDVATPFAGLFLSATGLVYGKYLGGDYNYEMIELEYRQFRNVFQRRSTLAWAVKTQIGLDNVPYTQLPMFGSPFDLRGYLWGKYRDKTMAYGIVEYRHMFMSREAYERGEFWSKFGAVAWVGTGTIGKTPAGWNKWKFNYGAGLRIQLQPRKNFRLDIGKEPGEKWALYLNMTEAF